MPTPLSTAAPANRAASHQVACSSCGLRELCLPVGFNEDELARLDGMVFARILDLVPTPFGFGPPATIPPP